MSKKAIAIAIAVLCSALALPAIAFAWSGAAEVGSIIGGRAATVLEAPDLPAGTAGGAAGSAAGGESRRNAAPCPGYQDADGDGLCDYHSTGCPRYAPSADTAPCPGYIDADGDGICDYHGTGCLHHPEHGSGISPNSPGYSKGNGSPDPGRGCGHHGGCRR